MAGRLRCASDAPPPSSRKGGNERRRGARPASILRCCAMGRQPWLALLAGAAWIACGTPMPPDAPIADAAPKPDSIPLTCDTVGQDCDTHYNPGTEKCSLVQNSGRLLT